MGIPDQLMPVEIEKQKLQPFLPTPQERSQLRPTQGGLKITDQNKKSKETQSGLEGPHPQEGDPQCSENQKHLRIAEPLEFFYELCMIEDN